MAWLEVISQCKNSTLKWIWAIEPWKIIHWTTCTCIHAYKQCLIWNYLDMFKKSTKVLNCIKTEYLQFSYYFKNSYFNPFFLSMIMYHVLCYYSRKILRNIMKNGMHPMPTDCSLCFLKRNMEFIQNAQKLDTATIICKFKTKNNATEKTCRIDTYPCKFLMNKYN